MRCTYDVFVRGSIFHVFNHGIDDHLLFYDDEDYNYFLITLEKQLNSIPADIPAYCLMPNHYHLIIKQNSDKKIYKMLNYAFISFARYFNKKYERKGPIFRSPLQHKLIEDNTYLFQVCKYIHLNPVYANLVDSPREWHYSNYLEWIGERDSIFIVKDLVKEYFPNPTDYEEYVNSINNQII